MLYQLMVRTLPHNHHHRAIIGMYGGGEDNIFWRRLPEDAKGRVEAAGAASLRQGDVTALGRDIIHSVTNPLDKVSYAIHVYDGDFLSAEGKSCWHAETLCEMPCDAGAVSPAFGHALVDPVISELKAACAAIDALGAYTSRHNEWRASLIRHGRPCAGHPSWHLPLLMARTGRL